MRLDETFTFTPRGAPAGVSFEIRPLTRPAVTEYKAALAKHGVDGDAGFLVLLKHGLVGWTGIEDADGKPARCTPANAMRINHAIIDGVAAEIVAMSFLSAEQKKTSSSRPRSTPTGRTSTAGPAAGGGTATKRTRRRSSSGKSRPPAKSSS